MDGTIQINGRKKQISHYEVRQLQQYIKRIKTGFDWKRYTAGISGPDCFRRKGYFITYIYDVGENGKLRQIPFRVQGCYEDKVLGPHAQKIIKFLDEMDGKRAIKKSFKEEFLIQTDFFMRLFKINI